MAVIASRIIGLHQVCGCRVAITVCVLGIKYLLSVNESAVLARLVPQRRDIHRRHILFAAAQLMDGEIERRTVHLIEME